MHMTDMEDENFQKPYKQRFKGVENFLRRIAFNLGNTPSQTEVKIISCIPIDVTDLQQKIINLEKQLYEAQQAEEHPAEPNVENDQDKQKANNNEANNKQDKEGKQGTSTVVNTAFVRRSSALSYASKKPVESFRTQQVCTYCGDGSSRQRKSNVSFVFPAISAPVEEACGSRENYNYENNDELQRSLGNDLYKSIFKRRKKKKVIGGKTKTKTQLIYYAQETPKSPFHLKDKSLPRNQNKNNEKDLSHSYLDSVVRKQYDPKNILEEFSDTSNFSKPVCRDIKDNLKHSYPYETDVCSCCHGNFQNLDSFIKNDLSLDPISSCPYKQIDRVKTYYDSNLYDMIPVKENSDKFLKPETLHKIDHRRELEMDCWPEKYRTKCRNHAYIVNYHTQIPIRRLTNKKNVEKTRVKRDRGKKFEKLGFETSKSCCIECSDIYTKTGTTGIKVQQSEPTRTILLKNKFVETDNNTITPANNQSTPSKVSPAKENKTESTLNQIKSILQSVLQEVKTNSNINTVPEITKKDAVIQKGSSQNNMPGNSTLLHSFTYNNSCNTNPYLPSCSRQISPGQYCFPNIPYQPVKCLQNFPVFIHPATGRPMCTCYYRNSLHRSSHNKQATISTNTDRDIQKSSSNETEKLIKEIYKSMALNMDYPTKDNTLSESDDLKSTEINSINLSNKEEKSTEAEILKKRDIEIEAMMSPLVPNTNENKFVYTAASSQSENNRFTSDLSFGLTPARTTFDDGKFKRVERQSTDTIEEVDVDTDESSDETTSDETIVLNESKQNKKNSKNLFKRMFNSVKIFKKRKEVERQKSESNEEQSEDTDSDEYETVHSGRTGKGTLNGKIPPNRVKQYSKGKTVSDQKSKRRVKRSPYLEQEYRRQWNENLMFHDQQEKYSSQRPFSRPTTSQPSSAQPAYWRDYEARRASVKHHVPSDLIIRHTVNRKIESETSLTKNIENNHNPNGKLAWIKKHNLGIHCGPQWKKFILEN